MPQAGLLSLGFLRIVLQKTTRHTRQMNKTTAGDRAAAAGTQHIEWVQRLAGAAPSHHGFFATAQARNFTPAIKIRLCAWLTTVGRVCVPQFGNYTQCMRGAAPYGFLRAPSYFTDTHSRDKPIRHYETFLRDARCVAEYGRVCPLASVRSLSGGALTAALNHRTLTFIGDSISREFYVFTACWLLAALVGEGRLHVSELADVARRSDSWHATFVKACRKVAPAPVVGNRSSARDDHPFVWRLSNVPFPHGGTALVLPARFHCTLAYVNAAHFMRKSDFARLPRGTLQRFGLPKTDEPMGRALTWLPKVALPALASLAMRSQREEPRAASNRPPEHASAGGASAGSMSGERERRAADRLTVVLQFGMDTNLYDFSPSETRKGERRIAHFVSTVATGFFHATAGGERGGGERGGGERGGGERGGGERGGGEDAIDGAAIAHGDGHSVAESSWRSMLNDGGNNASAAASAAASATASATASDSVGGRTPHLHVRWASEAASGPTPPLGLLGAHTAQAVGPPEGLLGAHTAQAEGHTGQAEGPPEGDYLVVMETPPQHFATPFGLYPARDSAGLQKKAPCLPIARRGHSAPGESRSPFADPSASPPPVMHRPVAPPGGALLQAPPDEAPLDDEAIANFRSHGIQRGVASAVAAASRADPSAGRRVHVLPLWEPLSRLSGLDAHGHHGDAARDRWEQGDPEHVGNLSASNQTKDCTHSSPDSLLFALRVLYQRIVPHTPGARPGGDALGWGRGRSYERAL